ncbi:hypothetical protein HZY86_07180 [Aerococcaceae bacterium DSM 111020]|nr:hypothetical protein [Aerococcaceae bacterium DSM 111020]
MTKATGIYQDYSEQPYISPNRDSEWFNKLDRGTVQRVPKRNMIRTSEQLLPGDIILLWRIQLGTFTNQSWFPKYFEYDYGIHAPSRLKHLIKEKYALQASAKDSLTHIPAPEIKAILKQKGVKGYSQLNKQQLIDLTHKALSEEELANLFDLRAIHLTKKGDDALKNNADIISRHPKKNI